MKIGFLGLGIMGQGMARNLALKGHDVTAWNRTTKAELKEKLPKVKLVSTIRDAVVDQEIVMIRVTGPDAQKGIYYGDQGLFAHVTSGTLVPILYSSLAILAVPDGKMRFCALMALITSFGVKPSACSLFQSMSTETTRCLPP